MNSEIAGMMDGIDGHLASLSEMLDGLDPNITDWDQILCYLKWVKMKMIVMYEASHEKRILDQALQVDSLIERIHRKSDYAHDL